MKKSYRNYFIALALFGSNGIVSSGIALSSCDIVLLRSILGSILLYAIFRFSGGKLSEFKPSKDVAFVALSGAAMAADWLFLFEAYAQIGVSMAVIINYCGPIIVVALSPLVFQEKITLKRLLSLIAAMSGALLVSEQIMSGTLNVTGLICAVFSAFSYAGMIIFNKKSESITGMSNAMLQLLGALVTVIIFVGLKQGFVMQIETADLPAIMWLGFVNTGVSCWLYFSSIGKLPVQTVAVCGYLEPLAAVLLAVVLLHEMMTPLQVFGAMLIMGGAVYGECSNFESTKLIA